MHHPTDWHDRIEAENGQIYRTVWAEWIDKRHNNIFYSVDVYKENDMSEAWEQNLYSSMYGGHTVMFPGLPRCDQKNSWYYDMTIADEEGWCARGGLSKVGWSDSVTEADKELVCSYYPEFKYVLKKFKMKSKRDLMDKLRMWIQHNEVELILAAGFEKVAMNKSFYRLSEKNQKATCLFMRQNPQFKEFSLREIRDAMKAESPKDYLRYLKEVPSYDRVKSSRGYFYHCVSYQDYKYLKKQQKKYSETYAGDKKYVFNSLMHHYIDYMGMLARSEHNPHELYWKYPSDINAFHDRLCEEERIKREAEALAKAKAAKEEMKRQKKILLGVKKKFKDIPEVIDGYSIFVSTDFEEWQKQAEVLHQCIVASGYYQGMAKGNYTIVFIQKEGVPKATAQIMPNGEIHQFYADEHSGTPGGSLPSEEIKTAFNKWLGLVPKSKFKNRIKQKIEAA